MPKLEEFDVFMEDEKGPIWKGYFNNLEHAKRKAQELADREGCPCFVYSVESSKEIARCQPSRRKADRPESGPHKT
jgi:hypothetical protein